MKYYTINKFSKMLGVTPQTLRNWEISQANSIRTTLLKMATDTIQKSNRRK